MTTNYISNLNNLNSNTIHQNSKINSFLDNHVNKSNHSSIIKSFVQEENLFTIDDLKNQNKNKKYFSQDKIQNNSIAGINQSTKSKKYRNKPEIFESED